MRLRVCLILRSDMHSYRYSIFSSMRLFFLKVDVGPGITKTGAGAKRWFFIVRASARQKMRLPRGRGDHGPREKAAVFVCCALWLKWCYSSSRLLLCKAARCIGASTLQRRSIGLTHGVLGQKATALAFFCYRQNHGTTP